MDPAYPTIHKSHQRYNMYACVYDTPWRKYYRGHRTAQIFVLTFAWFQLVAILGTVDLVGCKWIYMLSLVERNMYKTPTSFTGDAPKIKRKQFMLGWSEGSHQLIKKQKLTNLTRCLFCFRTGQPVRATRERHRNRRVVDDAVAANGFPRDAPELNCVVSSFYFLKTVKSERLN